MIQFLTNNEKIITFVFNILQTITIPFVLFLLNQQNEKRKAEEQRKKEEFSLLKEYIIHYFQPVIKKSEDYRDCHRKNLQKICDNNNNDSAHEDKYLEADNIIRNFLTVWGDLATLSSATYYGEKIIKFNNALFQKFRENNNKKLPSWEYSFLSDLEQYSRRVLAILYSDKEYEWTYDLLTLTFEELQKKHFNKNTQDKSNTPQEGHNDK